MNLSFLNPSALWLLPLALLPVAIHLFFKRKPALIQFSDLRFIELAAKNVAPRKKLHQILLLAARCILLLLLIMAFARPAGHLVPSSDAGKNREILILLDSSYSMNYRDAGRDRFTAAKDFIYSLCGKTLANAKRSKASTDISIAVFSDRIEKYSESVPDINEIRRYLDDCHKGYSGTDLTQALNFSYKSLSKFRESAKTIIVVSDMAGHVFKGSAEEMKTRIENYDPAVAVIFVEVGPAAYENSFVKDVSLEGMPEYFSAGLSCAGAGLSRPLSVTVDDKRIFEETVSLKPAEMLKKEFHNVQPPSTDESRRLYYPAAVRLQEDALPDDDIMRTVLKIEPLKKILIIDGEPKLGYGINSESYYINAALSEKGAKRFLVKTLNPDEFARERDFSKYDIVALCNMESIPQEAQNSLEASPPGAIAVFPGEKMNPELYPQWISQSFQAPRLDETVSLSSFVPAGNLTAEGIFPEINGFELEKISFNKYFNLNELNGNTMLRFNNGMPFMIRSSFKNVPVFIFAAGAGKSWGNFPSKPFYPYFVRSLFGNSGGLESTPVNYSLKTGEPFKYYLKSFPQGPVTVGLPDKSAKKTKIIRRDSGADVIFEDTFMPGFYTLAAPGGRIMFAVNVNPAFGESNLEKAGKSMAAKILPKTPLAYVEWSADSQKKTLNALEGVEISKEFLAAALLLLGLEILLALGVRS